MSTPPLPSPPDPARPTKEAMDDPSQPSDSNRQAASLSADESVPRRRSFFNLVFGSLGLRKTLVDDSPPRCPSTFLNADGFGKSCRTLVEGRGGSPHDAHRSSRDGMPTGHHGALNSLTGQAVPPTGENEARREPMLVNMQREPGLSTKTIMLQSDSKSQQVSSGDFQHSLQDRLSKAVSGRGRPEEISRTMQTSTAPSLKPFDLPGLDQRVIDDSSLMFVQPADLQLTKLLQDWVRDGVMPSWIHKDDVYRDDPAVLTAQNAPLNTLDNAQRWFFICTPKTGNNQDARIRRTAGCGTWKGDRGEFVRERNLTKIAIKSSFTFVMKKEGRNMGQGWIMKEFMLLDGAKIALYAIYRSPSWLKKQKEAAVAGSIGGGEAVAVTRAGGEPAPLTQAIEAASAGAETRAASAGAATVGGAAAPTAAAAAITTTALAEASPSLQRKWLRIQVSVSPTQQSDGTSAKRVYQVMVDDESTSVPAKKRRLYKCSGWLTLHPEEERGSTDGKHDREVLRTGADALLPMALESPRREAANITGVGQMRITDGGEDTSGR